VRSQQPYQCGVLPLNIPEGQAKRCIVFKASVFPALAISMRVNHEKAALWHPVARRVCDAAASCQSFHGDLTDWRSKT
jgi:hypothetical protein